MLTGLDRPLTVALRSRFMSAPPQKAFTAGLAKVRVTQKQNGNMPWQP